MKDKFDNWIKELRKTQAYQNYLKVRGAVFGMLDEMSSIGEKARPSKYWEEELGGFEYMFDASPLIISKLRQHCYHITGLFSYEYREHHAHKKGAFESKLRALQKFDPEGKLFVPESEELGGFGHRINGQLVNLDTLKFYESLIAMEKAGLLEKLKSQRRPVVIEIGAGWGGFAYQLKRLFPNVCYVIIDLPPTLIFSATYLMSLFPKAKVYLYQGRKDLVNLSLEEFDFLFLPHYVIEFWTPKRINLSVNMVSFQEMSTQQVYGYVEWLWNNECPYIYSHNRGRSPHNVELSQNVEDIIRSRYRISKVDLLPVPYTVLSIPQREGMDSDIRKTALRLLKRIAVGVKKPNDMYVYKHIVGKREP